MALICCPKCGESISDKANSCPHCGSALGEFKVPTESTIKCEECGNDYEKTLSTCPSCGCPTPTLKNQFQKPKKKYKITIAIAVILIVLIGGLLGINTIMKEAEYVQNMEDMANLMITGAVDAETAGNLIHNVWSNAIWEERDEETDKYTRENDRFVDDFNDALNNLFVDEEFSNGISKIQENQTQVTELMRKLKNPPTKYKESYDALKTCYEDYLKMTRMVISPTGSLQTFTEDFNAIETKLVESFDKLVLCFE